MENPPSARYLGRQLRDWIISTDGRREISEILAKAESATTKLDQDRQLEPSMLQEHFTL